MLRLHQPIFLLLILTKRCLSVGETITPQTFKWSSKSYGPDGPWHAVTIIIGTPPQPVDLFPGGSWQSNILAPSVCSQGPSCSIPISAGFYNSSLSSGSFLISQTGTIDNSTITDASWVGDGNWVFDTITVPLLNRFTGIESNATIQDFDMLVVTKADDTLPDGTTYPAQVGKLALGAPHFNQTWLHNPPNPNWNGTLITSALFQNKLVPSNSYGMHIGSTALGIPGSLTIGGYDQSRVLGPVSTQSYVNDHLPIELFDISIGTAEGGSPFPFASKSGLLAEGNSTISTSLTVNIEAPVPYLYLPQSTCEAITQHLPVTYSPTLGLYLWNTNSPNYSSIVTSPSYLAFTFSLSNSLTQNFTINVPFSLLNLTLTPPFVSIPTAYFPCRPAQGPTGSFELGRAFLQAAIIGVNWQTDNANGPWFLAQAPGPTIPTSIEATTISPSDNTIAASNVEWKDTWKNTWTVLPSNATSSAPSKLTPSKRQTTYIIWIVVAVAIGLAGCGAATWRIIFMKRKRAGRGTRKTQGSWGPVGSDHHEDESGGRIRYTSGGFGPRELDTSFTAEPRELDSNEERRGSLELDVRARVNEGRRNWRERWTIASRVEMAG